MTEATLKVMLVLGTRPQIIKSAPIIDEAVNQPEVELQIVHTGQHYDYEMSRIFFGELSLPKPVSNLEVGSGTHAWQVGEMMIKLEKIINELNPDMIVTPGDTNSTLAGALTAAKLRIPVFHVEAGARSYDIEMPEEINRRLTDHSSTVLLAPSKNCVKNLRSESVPGEIHLVGDTMYDALLEHMPRVVENSILEKLGLEPKVYAVLTLHRVENVNNPSRLAEIVQAVTQLNEITIIFPVHPRTKTQLDSKGLLPKIKTARHIRVLDPVGYYEMLKLVSNARFVLTDSGGLQKEAFWLKTPCITLRKNTEWVETVRMGANILVGTSRQNIIRKTKFIMKNENISNKIIKMKNPYGDGKAAKKIVKIITSHSTNTSVPSYVK